MMEERRENLYEDIIHCERPQSGRHPRMAVKDRAAQFSPFAALTGYEDVIRETGRWTEEKRELDEDRERELDGRLRRLMSQGDGHPSVRVTYFLQDERKDGGQYVTAEGRIRRLDPSFRVLVLEDRREIPWEISWNWRTARSSETWPPQRIVWGYGSRTKGTTPSTAWAGVISASSLSMSMRR